MYNEEVEVNQMISGPFLKCDDFIFLTKITPSNYVAIKQGYICYQILFYKKRKTFTKGMN